MKGANKASCTQKVRRYAEKMSSFKSSANAAEERNQACNKGRRSSLSNEGKHDTKKVLVPSSLPSRSFEFSNRAFLSGMDMCPARFGIL